MIQKMICNLFKNTYEVVIIKQPSTIASSFNKHNCNSYLLKTLFHNFY